MESKFIEIRDVGTCIAAIAFKMTATNYIEERFLYRAGYSPSGSAVILMRLDDQKATVDLYDWSSLGCGLRTMQHAHDFLEESWPTVVDGQVVDVRVILGEELESAESEILRDV